jgi:5,10-methylene-tetrahydrofolate dehydrogenase/methenyl tetrahydrofolate cyclohydrolase
MAMELLNARATVTICNSKTQDLPRKLKQADIVVVAVGIAKMIQGDWIKAVLSMVITPLGVQGRKKALFCISLPIFSL